MGAALGVTIVLTILMVCVHVLLAMWASTRAAAIAHDAARLVAEADDPGSGATRARAHVGAVEPAAAVTIQVSGTPPHAVVTVGVPGPTLVPLDPLPHGTIDRTARVPLELWARS